VALHSVLEHVVGLRTADAVSCGLATTGHSRSRRAWLDLAQHRGALVTPTGLWTLPTASSARAGIAASTNRIPRSPPHMPIHAAIFAYHDTRLQSGSEAHSSKSHYCGSWWRSRTFSKPLAPRLFRQPSPRKRTIPVIRLTTCRADDPADLKPKMAALAAPSKVRQEQLTALARWRRVRHSHRQAPVKTSLAASVTGCANCSRCQTVTRSSSATADDGVLGRRGVRADRQAFAASDLRRVQFEVRLVVAKNRSSATHHRQAIGQPRSHSRIVRDLIAWAHNERRPASRCRPAAQVRVTR